MEEVEVTDDEVEQSGDRLGQNAYDVTSGGVTQTVNDGAVTDAQKSNDTGATAECDKVESVEIESTCKENTVENNDAQNSQQSTESPPIPSIEIGEY